MSSSCCYAEAVSMSTVLLLVSVAGTGSVLSPLRTGSRTNRQRFYHLLPLLQFQPLLCQFINSFFALSFDDRIMIFRTIDGGC